MERGALNAYDRGSMAVDDGDHAAHKVWFVPRTVMCSIFWLSNIFLFTGIILLVTGKHRGEVYRSWGAVMLGIGFCLLLTCLILCLHAYCIITVDNEQNKNKVEQPSLGSSVPPNMTLAHEFPGGVVSIRETCFDDKTVARCDPPSYQQCTKCNSSRSDIRSGYASVNTSEETDLPPSRQESLEAAAVWQPVEAAKPTDVNAQTKREQFSKSRMSEWLQDSSSASAAWRPAHVHRQASMGATPAYIDTHMCQSDAAPRSRMLASGKPRSMTVDEAREVASGGRASNIVNGRRHSQPATSRETSAEQMRLGSQRPPNSSMYDNLQCTPVYRDTVRHFDV